MSQEQTTLTTTPAMGTLALTFLAGAAIGAIVVALTTPKSGPELRGDLKDLGIKMRKRASELVKDREESQVDLGV
ncbi:MAG TPA: YtxH domain-containing protein [Holophagaceae bacterium]|nr:YtxH domain-containing protein [Holophagaceae bacterium]